MSTEASFQMTVRFDYPVNIWVLQLGGWLPIQFTGVQTILVDRCVTIAARELATNPDREDMREESWWLQQLNSSRFALNAILCAAEGWTTSIPTFEAFVTELVEHTEILTKAFPLAKVIRHPPEYFAPMFEIVTATRERHAREASFLAEVAPLLVNRVAASRSRKVENQVVDLAKTNLLLPHSIVVLAALSCLYEPQDGEHPRIGRGVLKLTSDYGPEQIHNTLADIRSLEYLSVASGIGNASVGFCTRDKALAAFWTHLGMSEAVWQGNTFTATYAPSSRLFPRLQEQEVSEFLHRLLR